MWDIVRVSPQGHRSVSVSRHFLLQAPQCPWSMRQRFSRDHCCRGRSKPVCRIVGSHTRWELTTWADFQLCLINTFNKNECNSNSNITLYSSTCSRFSWSAADTFCSSSTTAFGALPSSTSCQTSSITTFGHFTIWLSLSVRLSLSPKFRLRLKISKE